MVESLPKLEPPRESYKFPTIGGYLERVKAATLERVKTAAIDRVTSATLEWGDWYESDEWRKRFGNKVLVIPVDENKAYLEVLHATGLEIDEIPAFMTPYPSSPRWERRVLLVEGFCEGADFTLRNFVPDDATSSRLQDTQEPKAWVSDRNLIHPRNGQSRQAYGRIVNNVELYEIVQQKVQMLSSVTFCFPESHNTQRTNREVKSSGSARIHLKRFRVALDESPASHVSGFRKLFAGYLDPYPIADLSLSDANWWGAANFVISFNLPFFAIGTQDNQDNRTLSGNQYLRARYDLDFLYLRDESAIADQQDSTSFHEKAVLHEAVYSLVITGRSERYWTAVCLDDDFFEEEPRLAEEDIVEASEDPIIIQAELKATGTTRSPRAYALASLEKELEKIVEYHGNVQDWFSKGLDRYTNIARGDDSQGVQSQQIQHWERRFPDLLDRVINFNSNIANKVNGFLAGYIMLGQKELLQGPLWQGLQGDYGALGSLRGIKSSFSQLSDIDGHLRILKEKEKVFRRERENYHAKERQKRDKRMQQITIAAFVLAILNLVAQVYAGKPDSQDSSSTPGYITLVIIFNVICVPGILWFLCPYVSCYSKKLWELFASKLQNARSSTSNLP
ncbi:hypothetical protein FACUT_3772 [Fusarium acutatum]|uniref:Uncharacterized protein n=1 Tax=Fusarium acutatum TaxID=78861 RepID=A0A8H4NVY9_9HYPO|nr:hypothetical protein FACUT_3772 [Fusarium acutatum]